MDTANLLIVEGALVGVLVVMRMICVQLADLDSLPRVIMTRVELGNRVAPWFGVLALAAIVIGLALRIGW
ncbi:MAG: hypothetical protein L0H20_07995 [Corynebacterium sp.]|uniref:hypothetical protein n=1 Tax=Corynebacterium sp. TaxID=1720 RepID=UPI00264791C9|nr:hypothetical protein [Corynebacterium sp.]MDN5722924.1 hypothetical protein [Corynebacterium sp.]